MRLLILATASTLVLTGTAMADGSVQTDVMGAQHHYRDANASVPCRNANASLPEHFVDANAHDMYIKNLRDSGYNPACDRNANGNVIEANMYQLKRIWRPKMNTP
jgi:hypothetical protein